MTGDIENIHAVRDSYRAVEAMVSKTVPADEGWTAAVNKTNWLAHLRTVLAAGLMAAEALHRRGQSVVVHCSVRVAG